MYVRFNIKGKREDIYLITNGGKAKMLQWKFFQKRPAIFLAMILNKVIVNGLLFCCQIFGVAATVIHLPQEISEKSTPITSFPN